MDHASALKTQACEKYLLGELSPDLRDAFEEHYFGCAECAIQLRTTAELVGAAQRIFAAAPASTLAPTPAFDTQRVPRTAAWRNWFRPAIAIPVFATLLLLLAYQNFVTIPHLKQSATPRVLQMFSLISANTRGEEIPEYVARPDEPVGLFVDIPADAAYSTYQINLLAPNGKTTTLRSLNYAEAQKTQVVVINPANQPGKYSIIILGQSKPEHGIAAATVLARMQFTIAFSDRVQQH